MKSKGMYLPNRRNQNLIVDELPDEVLIYDLDRHQAHCLNHTAAAVWRQCDGKSSAQEIARRVTRELDQPFNDELVWLALRELDKSRLLNDSFVLPPRVAGMSRRQMVKALGIAAVVAVPVVTSIVSPTAAEAATCVPAGGACNTSAECCSKQCLGNHTCHS